VVAEHDNEGSF